jgi:hypothetical protein
VRLPGIGKPRVIVARARRRGIHKRLFKPNSRPSLLRRFHRRRRQLLNLNQRWIIAKRLILYVHTLIAHLFVSIIIDAFEVRLDAGQVEDAGVIVDEGQEHQLELFYPGCQRVEILEVGVSAAGRVISCELRENGGRT